MILQSVLDGLAQKNHVTELLRTPGAVVQAVVRQGDKLFAESDPRKGGYPAGYWTPLFLALLTFCGPSVIGDSIKNQENKYTHSKAIHLSVQQSTWTTMHKVAQRPPVFINFSFWWENVSSVSIVPNLHIERSMVLPSLFIPFVCWKEYWLSVCGGP